LAAADRELQRRPKNEDALLMAAGANLQARQDQKAVDYAHQLITAMPNDPQPEGMSAADWQKKKDTTLGIAYWIQGVGSSNLHHFQDADKALRQALPLVKDNPETLGIGLFHLGVSDYELGKATKSKAMLQDALKFSQQSAALKSPVQAQAHANALAIRKQLGVAK
jgi:tetratricopeptide (TPR) repeat protein